MNTKDLASKNNERGATILFFAFALVALIGIGALAVDIGMGLVVRSELQNVSDAAALAGTRELAVYYTTHTDEIMSDLNSSSFIKDKAKQYALLNNAWGHSVEVLDGDDLLLGTVTSDGSVESAGTKVRALQVTSRRDETANGVVPTTLARVLGISQMNVSASTAAALTPLGTLNGGQGDFPIGISERWFDTHQCNDDSLLELYPTSNCAGWHVFEETDHSRQGIKTVINGLKTGKFPKTTTIADKTEYNFNGGVVEAECLNLKALFEAKKGKNGVMLANVPVYKDPASSGCGNPNGLELIIGFVNAEIQQVTCAKTSKGEKYISAKVTCGMADGGTGSGGGAHDFGLLSMLPNMVY